MKKELLLSLIVLPWFACSAIQERLALKNCKFALASVDAYDFGFSNMKLDFVIKVDNPNDVDATLDKLTYDFLVNATEVFNGTTGRQVKIPAKQSHSFTTTVTLEYAKIGQALVEAIRLEKADYAVNAEAHINTPLGEIVQPVDIALK